ncbi:hypothetical protein [Floricoccus penangensis]|uniref:hypothetical protein n=1 Tax=Floricoccus penangensis TaxID=1859475 RepID=UPI00203C1277|nr:hypothetical protein [Floricoccus penangensis]URZ86539.1 hypothetical protein KIW23_05390 [Floricoccus penangensis]
MNEFERYTIKNIDFKYPNAYYKLIELGLTDFDIWFFMEEKQATGIFEGMKNRYPDRNLIPFAKRSDNDDTACFELETENKVQLIHDFASSGWEQRGEYEDLWSWLKEAIDTLVDFSRDEEGI